MFGLYLMAYTAGRCWIEMLRIDDAHRILGLRLNVWTSLLVFALGALVFVVAGRLGRPTRVVAETTADNADGEGQDLHTCASESDADDVVGTSVSEDETAEESALEQF